MKTARLLNVLFALSVLAYVFVYVNVPFTLRPGSIHDDGLFMQHGYSLASGRWLGPYNHFTLMKGAGYPAFLAVVSWLRLPVSMAQGLLFGFSIWLLALVTQKLSGSAGLSVAVFEFALWNFGPETNRVLRDAIYQSQFVMCFSLTVFALLAKGRRAMMPAVLAGLCFGWLWLTREEGLAILPFFLMVLGGRAFSSYLRHESYRPVGTVASLFAVGALLPGLLVASVNRVEYGKFETVDMGGDFARAISALEAIDQAAEKPFLAISREVREKAYGVSPTFAQLRKLFDDPVVPAMQEWKGIGCDAVASTCGDYALGWFMWAMRDAAFLNGEYATPNKAAAFYRAIHLEISDACRAGKLRCHQPALAFLPHMTAEELRAVPIAAGALVKRLLFLTLPEVRTGFSFGSPEQMRDAVIFTNIQNYQAPPEVPQTLLNTRTIRVALFLKAAFILCYSKILPVVLPISWVAFLYCVVTSVRQRRFGFGLMIVTATWTVIALRTAMLALINVTAFPTLFHYYLSFAFPMSCFAALLSLYMAGQLLSNGAPREVLRRGRTETMDSDTMLSHES